MIADEVFYFYIFSVKITTFLGIAIFELALECRRIFCKDSFFIGITGKIEKDPYQTH
jgi:hypothetical protein